MFTLDALQSQIPSMREFRRAPTHLWQPDDCGAVDIRIAEQGQWWHEGTVIRRESLVRLLASVLVREGDTYWLKTPGEKLQVQVDDAPFIVPDLKPVKADDPGADDTGALHARTNVGEEITLTNPWTLQPTPDGEWLPWLPVHDGLGARLTRNLYYHLCHQALAQNHDGNDDGILYWHAVGQYWPLGQL